MTSKRSIALLLILVGLAVAGVAAVLGFTGITRAGSACGSAFKPDRFAGLADDFTAAALADQGGYVLADVGSHHDACAEATATRKTAAMAVLVPGAVVLLAGLAVGGVAIRQHQEGEGRQQDAVAVDLQPDRLP